MENKDLKIHVVPLGMSLEPAHFPVLGCITLPAKAKKFRLLYLKIRNLDSAHENNKL